MQKIFLLFFFLLSGILTTEASNYYWVGGTGNWSDINHWVTSSGGSVTYLQVPSAIDDVYFDDNSFTGASQTVTINISTAFCHDMIWTDALYNPKLASTGDLRIYGSLILIPSMTFSVQGRLFFESNSAGNIITSAGHHLVEVVFEGAGGGWILQDSLNVGPIQHFNGSLNSNGQNITCDYFYGVTCSSCSYSLCLDNSIITALTGWELHGEKLSFSATNSLIRIEKYSFYHSGPPKRYHNVELSGYLSMLAGGGSSFNSVIFSDPGTLNDADTIKFLKFLSDGIIESAGNKIGTAWFSGDGTISGSNIFDSLLFTMGHNYQVKNGATQTINKSFVANGNCSEEINIESSLSGNQTTFRKTNGSVILEHVALKDINATGVIPFIANNSMDLGNNSGWQFNGPGPQNHYWVGGTGNWNDPGHWSLVSGGPGGACIPTEVEDVFFDASSFNSTNQHVYLNDIHSVCRCMNWTGSLLTPTLSGSNDLEIHGSLTLIPAMVVNMTGSILFKSNFTGNTITSAGQHFISDFKFIGSGGGWLLGDNLNTTQNIYLVDGTLNTNGTTVTANSFNSDYTNPRTLNITNSIFNLGIAPNIVNSWIVNGTNLTFLSGNSLIRILSGMFKNKGTAKVYHDVELTPSSLLGNGSTFNTVTFFNSGNVDVGNTFNLLKFYGAGTISGNNQITKGILLSDGSFQGNSVFDTLVLAPGHNYEFEYSSTQRILQEFTANGNCSGDIFFFSSEAGQQAMINKNSGSVTLDYITLKDIRATGEIPFVANHSTDLGNNFGWTINGPGAVDLFWVGGTGNWSDNSHWSTHSGGPGGACLPSGNDNVFFDAHSFTAPNQIVTLNSTVATCHNMSWTGVVFNPKFTGANNLKIYGSLTLANGMQWNLSGGLMFLSASQGNSIMSSNHSFNQNITFDGNGGGWILSDSLFSYGMVFLNSGSLNTNGKHFSCSNFLSNTDNYRSLNIDNSIIRTNDMFNDWEINGTNLVFSSNNSLILSNSGFHLTGTPKTYNDVLINDGSAIGSSNYNHLTFLISGQTYGTDTINVLKFLGFGQIAIDNNCRISSAFFGSDGSIGGNNVFDTLILSPGHTYQLSAGSTQTILGEFNCKGSGCYPITIMSATSSHVQSIISKAGGIVSCEYLELKDQKATGGAQFYAGRHSTSLSNNTGWVFSDAPGYQFGLGPDTTLCAGDTVILTTAGFNGGVSWLWNNGSTGSTLAITQPGLYWVKVTYENNCYMIDSVNLTLRLPPVAHASSNSPVCFGDTLKLHGSGGNRFLWSGPNGFSSILQNPFILNMGTSETGKYYLTVFEGSCSSLRDSILVSSAPGNLVGVGISASPQGPVCGGTIVSFNAVPVNGGTAPSYQWKVNGLPVGGNSQIYSRAPLNGDIITCTMTSNAVCPLGNPANSNTLTMSVNQQGTAGISISCSSNPFCLGSGVTFTANALNGGSNPVFQWLVNGVPSGMNSTLFSFNPQNGDSVKCIMISNLICVSGNPSSSQTIHMTGIPIPDLRFSACFDTVTTVHCKPFILKGGIPLNGTYYGAGVNSTTGVFDPSLAGPGTKRIVYSYTNSMMCSASKFRSIVVLPDPVFICGNTLTDVRDLKRYPSVKIGSQCWMAVNLDNGNAVLSTKAQTDNCISEKYCLNDNSVNCDLYGGLYQWDELMKYYGSPGGQGLCPPGWHVPTENEWSSLFNFYRGNALAGSPMKDLYFNQFNARIKGINYLNSIWSFADFATFFWSSTSLETTKAFSHGLNVYNCSVSLYSSARSNAFPVRCVQD